MHEIIIEHHILCTNNSTQKKCILKLNSKTRFGAGNSHIYKYSQTISIFCPRNTSESEIEFLKLPIHANANHDINPLYTWDTLGHKWKYRDTSYLSSWVKMVPYLRAFQFESFSLQSLQLHNKGSVKPIFEVWALICLGLVTSSVVLSHMLWRITCCIFQLVMPLWGWKSETTVSSAPVVFWTFDILVLFSINSS